jgi:hypothetical protein
MFYVREMCSDLKIKNGEFATTEKGGDTYAVHRSGDGCLHREEPWYENGT